jgi:hypothetical protein
MTVLAIRRATQQVLFRLPSDLTPMIRGWIGGTRADWRTCKRPEALIIENYNEGIRRFVQELRARRRERSIPLSHPIRYQMYRIWIYWYGLYQIIVMVWEWVNSHIRGN